MMRSLRTKFSNYIRAPLEAYGFVLLLLATLYYCRRQPFHFERYKTIVISFALVWIGSTDNIVTVSSQLIGQPLQTLSVLLQYIRNRIYSGTTLIGVIMLVSYVRNAHQFLYPFVIHFLCSEVVAISTLLSMIRNNIFTAVTMVFVNTIEIYFSKTIYVLSIIIIVVLIKLKRRKVALTANEVTGYLIATILVRHSIQATFRYYPNLGYTVHMMQHSSLLTVALYSIRASLTHRDWLHVMYNIAGLHWYQRQLSDSTNRYWKSPYMVVLLFFGGCAAGAVLDSYVAIGLEAQHSSKLSTMFTCSWTICKAMRWNSFVYRWFGAAPHESETEVVLNEMHGNRVGASAGVCAIMGAHLACMLYNRFHRNTLHWDHIASIVGVAVKVDFAMRFLFSEYTQTAWYLDTAAKSYSNGDTISHSSHLAGFIFGIVIAICVCVQTPGWLR